MTVLASIVVPTRRRDELLERCLRALADQRLPSSEYEVVVADDAGSASTKDLVACLASTRQTTLRYIRVEKNHGPAAARNAGWRAAQGRFIAFTDDDCIPTPDWLPSGLKALSFANAATGPTIVPLPDQPTDYQRDCARLGQSEFVTANCFCRRSTLEAIGGFDERFTDAWREDSDLHFTLLERGYRIAFSPQSVVVHPVRPAPWGISLKQQKKAASNALLFKKHPVLYRARIPRKPPSYYASVASAIAALAGYVAATASLATFFGVIWLMLTISFCVRRLHGTSHAPIHVAEMLVTSLLIPPLSVYWHFRGLVKHRVLFL
jgi:glycosyltransferase involved in cell wall biosynthesis